MYINVFMDTKPAIPVKGKVSENVDNCQSP